MTKTKAVKLSATTAEPVKSAEPYAELMTITPEIAAEWLELNTRNRGQRPRRIEQYGGDMLGDAWRLTGDSIRWASTGILLDGQHRLAGCVASRKAFRTFVIWNLEPEVQQYIDTGAARTPSDAMRLNGEKNPAIVAAASRLGFRIENGIFIGENQGKRASHADIMGWLDRNPAVRRSAELASAWHSHMNVTPAVIAYTHFRFAILDVYQADEFYQRIASLTFEDGSPVKAFAKRLAMLDKQDAKTTQRQLVMMCYRAWNAFREGKTMTVFPAATRWDQSHGLPELV